MDFTGEKDAARFLERCADAGLLVIARRVRHPVRCAAGLVVGSDLREPAATSAIGLSVEGLPIAVQVSGPHLGDLTTIAFTGMLAREVPAPLVA